MKLFRYESKSIIMIVNATILRPTTPKVSLSDYAMLEAD